MFAQQMASAFASERRVNIHCLVVITAQLVRFVAIATVQVAVANVRVRNTQMSRGAFEFVRSTFHMGLFAHTIRREVLVCAGKIKEALISLCL